MYDMKGFGARIAALRKSKDMTQDELAQRLGLTSQAVSKWENDLAFPDITLIPTICAIFDVSLDDLFGKIQKDISKLEFPPVFKGLALVHSFANIACYSDKEVSRAYDSTVKFMDGSMAELQSRRVVNKGQGRIILKTLDESFVTEHSINNNIIKKLTGKDKEEMSSIKHEYGDIMQLDCSIVSAGCIIEKADGDVTTVSVEGYAEFIDLLKFDYDGVLLKIYYDKDKWDKIGSNKWDHKKNNINISLASKLERLDKTALAINSSGTIDLKVPAEKFDANIHGSGAISAGKVDFGGSNVNIHGSGNINFGNAGGVNANIHGSGAINFGNAGGVNANIHGSGNINFGNAGGVNVGIHGSGVMKFGDAGGVNAGIHGSGVLKIGNAGNVDANIHGSGNIGLSKCGGLKIDIHGSGNMNADEVTKSVNVSIRGAGEINIKQGEVETFDVYIDKKGEINAKGVTADRAKVEMPNKGKVEIGRVKIESVEICGDDAEVIIHQRG